MTLERYPVEFFALPSAQVSAGPVALPTGQIRSVFVLYADAPTPQPHGRVYCQVLIHKTNKTQAIDSKDNIGTMWEGYPSAGHAPMSLPGIIIENAWAVVLAWGNSQVAAAPGTRMQAIFVIETDPKKWAFGGGGFLYSELPGSGRGELINRVITAPAAGANPADLVVPVMCAWNVHNVSNNFVASATVISRQCIAEMVTPGGTGTDALEGAEVKASENWQITYKQHAAGYGFFSGRIDIATSPPGGFAMAPWPVNAPMYAGWLIRFVTTNIQVGDQYNTGDYVVEEWAYPQ